MPISDKKKISNANWDRQNMTNLSCRVTKDYAEKAKAYARDKGETIHSIIKKHLDTLIESDQAGRF